MADATLTFAGWSREKLADLITGVSGGRATGRTSVTLTGTDAGGAGTGSRSADLAFSLAGPGDVLGLNPGAISRRYPTPGATDHESDRCPLVEFTDAALPWRYTPGVKPAAGTGSVHPWVVLVVGTEDELQVADQRVTVTVAAQQLHPLGSPTSPYPWAHLQTDAAGHRIGRVLSGRPLAPGTDYLVALVPAFRSDGTRSWDGSADVLVALYDSWRFRTAVPAGSFEELAAALHAGDAPRETGRAPLDYPRVPAAPDLELRGALAPINSDDAPLPVEIGTDLAGLRTPATDEVGRPIVGLPRYGEAWSADAPDSTTWGRTTNGDPRHRGVAGLGLELGIQLQDELVEDALTQLGALAEARQKVSFLVLGLAASGALWNHRLPTTPSEQLWMLGPALGRMATSAGTVRELSTATDRALPAGVWSTAARRVLRSGPSRAASTQPGTIAAAPALQAANAVPPPPPSFDGVRVPREFDASLAETLQRGTPSPAATRALAEQATQLSAQTQGPAKEAVDRVVRRLDTSRRAGRPANYAEALVLIAAGSVARRPEQRADLSEALINLGGRFDQPAPSSAEQLETISLMGAADPPPEPALSSVDIGALAGGVVTAFDPTSPAAAARNRILGTLGGLDPRQPLAPPEACVGLDRPIWRDVNGAFPEWLLPGLSAVPQDAVIALQTNPTFVHALLLGLNTQLLDELRWRNVPVATGCTPLRGFWQRAAPATGGRADDILGMLNWPDGSDLGDASQQPPGLNGRDVVVAVRGRLFLRYPTTVVYLTGAALTGTTPNFDVDPPATASRVLPTFQGRIGDDLSFFGFEGVEPDEIGNFWLVFEEPRAGYRFANDVSTATAPADWAAAAFARPVRVLIRGDRLVPA